MSYKNLLWILPLSALLITSCKKKEEETQTDTKAKVSVINAEMVPVNQTVTLTANVEGDVTNQISPAIPMRIKKIYVDVGANVHKGQALVQMDNSNLEQQNVQIKNLEKDYNRYEELLKVGGISQQQFDQLKAQLDVARAAISNTKENTVLTSPINGIVTARNYDDGDVYGQKPILTVQQLNPVKAIINVSESYFPKVQQGMPVEVQLDVYGNEVFQGKVKLIHPVIDTNTHTFSCEIEIPNKDMRVRPGMFSRVTMNFGSQNRVLIPDNAVIKQAGSNDRFVFLVADGKAIYKKVEIGQHLDTNFEILSGIQQGDVVVTAGQARLIDGTEVEIVKE